MCFPSLVCCWLQCNYIRVTVHCDMCAVFSTTTFFLHLVRLTVTTFPCTLHVKDEILQGTFMGHSFPLPILVKLSGSGFSREHWVCFCVGAATWVMMSLEWEGASQATSCPSSTATVCRHCPLPSPSTCLSLFPSFPRNLSFQWFQQRMPVCFYVCCCCQPCCIFRIRS